VNLSWKPNGFFSTSTTGSIRSTSFGSTFKRAGPSSYQSATVQGTVGSDSSTGASGNIGQNQFVLISIQR
jgi:hypothetical protein